MNEHFIKDHEEWTTALLNKGLIDSLLYERQTILRGIIYIKLIYKRLFKRGDEMFILTNTCNETKDFQGVVIEDQ